MTVIIDGTNGITFPNSTVQASAGSVLQVVNATYNTETTTTSGTPVATSWTVSITPKFATSKILLISKSAVRVSASNNFGALEWYRGATAILPTPQQYEFGSSNGADVRGNMDHVILDNPATTSAITYTAYIRAYSAASSTFYLCPNAFYSSVCLMEIAG
jgi:hypothetical protein